jgi:hypothetical protein
VTFFGAVGPAKPWEGQEGAQKLVCLLEPMFLLVAASPPASDLFIFSLSPSVSVLVRIHLVASDRKPNLKWLE